MFSSQKNMQVENGLLLCNQFPPVPHPARTPPLSMAAVPVAMHTEPRVWIYIHQKSDWRLGKLIWDVMTIIGTDPRVVAAVSFHRWFPGDLHYKPLPIYAKNVHISLWLEKTSGENTRFIFYCCHQVSFYILKGFLHIHIYTHADMQICESCLFTHMYERECIKWDHTN